jgi:hypothetical protein
MILDDYGVGSGRALDLWQEAWMRLSAARIL